MTEPAPGITPQIRVTPRRRAAPAVSARRLAEVAFGLARHIDDWTAELPRDPSFRTGIRLLETDEYDAWLLHWPVGTNVEPHDHGESKGVFTVVKGELTELRWHAGLTRSRMVAPGVLVSIPAGVVHDVVSTSEPSLSVHVYSPPLTSMGFFDDSGRRLATREVAEEPVGPERMAHPAYGR